MPRKPVNPINPLTGKRVMGRPRKHPPLDTMQGPQPVEHAVGENGGAAPVEVRAVDDRKDIAQSTPSAKFWRERMRGISLLTIPQEVRKQLPHIPEDCFCWAPNTSDGMSQYRDQFGYEVVQLEKPMRGQTDTTVSFRELVLMYRTPELKHIHDEVLREAVQAAHGHDAEGRGQSAEREALDEGQQLDPRFFEEEDTFQTTGTPTPTEQRRMTTEEVKDRIAADQRRARSKGAAGRGSKYVPGGFTK